MASLLATKSYARIPVIFDLPDLIEVQLESFRRLKEDGLGDLFHEISPIESYNKGMKLYFPSRSPEAKQWDLKYWFEPHKHSIEECVELTREDVEKSHGKNLADIRGEIVPYIRLREEFALFGTAPEIEQIVTARINDRRIGFVVDEVVGEHQTVIKSLGRIYRDVDDVSGATILGDGRVALILDLPKLLNNTENRAMIRQSEIGY